MTVAPWTVQLDPVAVIPNRTMLSLNSSGINVEQAGIDWGESAIKAFLAEQLYGEAPSAFRVPNRMVTIPLGLGTKAAGTEAEGEEARKKLQAKVALFQRRGGVVLRQRASGSPLYADIVNASLTIPDHWGEGGTIEPSAVLKLECLPDFYGEEIELDQITGSGNLVGVLKDSGTAATIFGDYPARTRIELDEEASKDQRGLLWGLRSTHYDAASTAALAIDAKDMTPTNGGKVVNKAGCYSGKGMEINPVVSAWHPFMKTDLAAGPLTHVGSYRVWARVYAEAHGQQIRLVWSGDDALTPIENQQQGLEGEKQFSIVDLGEITITDAPLGENWWRGFIQLYSLGEVPIIVDRIWFQPLDDGAGKLRATGEPGAANLIPANHWSVKGANSGGGAKAWTNPNFPAGSGTAQVELPIFGEATKTLLLSEFNVNLPEGVTVRGIQARFFRAYVHPGGGAFTVNLPGGATAKSLLLGGETTRAGYVTMGSSSDLWGKGSWSTAEINASTFGLLFNGSQLSLSNPMTLEVGPYNTNKVEIEVWWTFTAGALTSDAILYSTRSAQVRYDGSYRQDVSTEAYVRVSQELGDLVRLPPSGLEAAPVELFVKNSRLLLDGNVDAGIDAIKATVFYRPCYIGRI